MRKDNPYFENVDFCRECADEHDNEQNLSGSADPTLDQHCCCCCGCCASEQEVPDDSDNCKFCEGVDKIEAGKESECKEINLKSDHGNQQIESQSVCLNTLSQAMANDRFGLESTRDDLSDLSLFPDDFSNTQASNQFENSDVPKVTDCSQCCTLCNNENLQTFSEDESCDSKDCRSCERRQRRNHKGSTKKNKKRRKRNAKDKKLFYANGISTASEERTQHSKCEGDLECSEACKETDNASEIENDAHFICDRGSCSECVTSQQSNTVDNAFETSPCTGSGNTSSFNSQNPKEFVVSCGYESDSSCDLCEQCSQNAASCNTQESETAVTDNSKGTAENSVVNESTSRENSDSIYDMCPCELCNPKVSTDKGCCEICGFRGLNHDDPNPDRDTFGM